MFEKEEFIKKYDELKSSVRMAEFYNCCDKTILNYAKKIGYINYYRAHLSDKDKDEIVSQYYTSNSRSLAEKYNCSTGLIKKIWRESGCLGKGYRIYYMNFSYFNKIDCKDKAYFLGFIAADGCVYKRKGHVGMLSISLSAKDREILDMFNCYTESTYIVKDYIANNRKYVNIQYNSNELTNSLIKLGIVPRKTWLYIPQQLENDELMWHYVRGFFDGDGSIYRSGGIRMSNWTIQFTCNKQVMLFLQNFFEKHNLKCNVFEDRKGKYTKDLYSVRIRANKDKIKFFKLLYKNSNNLRMNRKFNRFLKMMKSDTPSI